MDAEAIRAENDAVEVSRLGTRFRVFPQPPFIRGYENPEVVWISTPPGEITAGPADRRMYVVDPVTAKRPYGYPYLPPYEGLLHPPVEPGPDGHFDHLQPGSRAFVAAHAYACTRRMFDICESYLGREVPWFFGDSYEKLEIVPRLAWENAQAGYGFLELGEDYEGGEPFPLALSFDAIAHEAGHLILFGVPGLPSRGGWPENDWPAYHDAAADFLALIGLLHFDTALDLLLRRTRGNLLVINELDRFAEISEEKQIRLFSHSLKLGDVSQQVHDRSRPFAAALFDLLVEVYQVLLFERGLTDLDPRDFDDLRRLVPPSELDSALGLSRVDHERRHFAEKSAIAEARDIVGELLVGSWRLLDADSLSFSNAAAALIQTAEEGRARRFADSVFTNFAWRGIL